MGKLTIVAMLGLLIAVLAVSTLFVRREAFEDATGTAPPMVGPDVPNPSDCPPPDAPNPSVTPSTEVANEKGNRAALLRDIQQVIHNELASFKGMTTASSQPLFQTESAEKVLLSEDPSLQQGTELKAARPTYCPKDMSQYIRKDQIPCWGCTLDY